jgi:Protein of unknown function (DUF3109)
MHIGKYDIDPILFEKGFLKGCGPFACESTCCAGGVYVDLKEKELILSHKETVKKYMDETQLADDTRWFDNDVEDDADFPSGKIVGTEVVNDKCVFLNKTGLCSLQIAGTEEKLGRWALKPFYCVAFPITVEEGVLTFDDFLNAKTSCCSLTDNKEATLVEACKEELEFVLGSSGYKTLSEMRKEFLSKQLPLSAG